MIGEIYLFIYLFYYTQNYTEINILQIPMQTKKERTIVSIIRKRKRMITVERRLKGNYEVYTN